MRRQRADETKALWRHPQLSNTSRAERERERERSRVCHVIPDHTNMLAAAAAAAAVVETLRKIKQTCKVQRILVVVFCSHALILESIDLSWASSNK